MRHQRKTIKLGRSQAHRDALIANQTCSLIEHNRIKTTLAKAKAVRPFAEKMVTLGKKNTLHSPRRLGALVPAPQRRRGEAPLCRGGSPAAAIAKAATPAS